MRDAEYYIGHKAMTDNEGKARLAAAIKGFHRPPDPPFGRCMWWKSECDKPVKSHSVSRACLEKLQRKGHVLHFHANIDIPRHSAEITSDLIGVNDAGVFPGFCATHDHAIFQTVDAPLNSLTQSQCDLLMYRSLCREAYTKYRDAKFNLSQGMVEDNPTPHGVFTVDMICCCTDLLAHKVGMEDAMDNGRSECNHFAIKFRQPPIVAATATFCPQVAFDGVALTGGLEWLTVTVLPSATGGIAVLSWDKSQVARTTQLLDSLLRVKHEWVSDVLLRYVIDNTENAFYSPDWWDSLAAGKRSEFVERYTMTMASPHSGMRDLYGTYGRPLVNWDITQMGPVI